MFNRKTVAAALLAAVLVTSACGTENETIVDRGASGGTKTRSQEPPADDEAGPAVRTIGDTVTLRDDGGKPMQVTLTGVAYRNAFAKDKTLPLTGQYAMAVSFTMKSRAGGRLGGLTDNMIKWENAGDTAEAWDYADAPWQGCIDDYSPFAEIEPGQEHRAITELNVFSRGGFLIVEDQYGGVARWELPAKDAGTGTEPATKYTTTDC
ncbi:hypothetical protein ABZ729_32785 [Streptomyces sp. NPDC006678]|uniref:hypothetical protein n=1 Tax=unclassified Streptomyces TaxID=2593676 RepID=UPI0033B24EA1